MWFANMLDFVNTYITMPFAAVGLVFMAILIGLTIHTEWKYREELQQIREKNEQQQKT
jgi:hypothetical protein